MKPKYLHLLASGAAVTALAAVLPLGLSSCSNDDLDSPTGRSASMTLTVSKGALDNTRTELREENGSLVASWTAGENPDRLLVADASGRRLGYLTLTSIDPQDASVATFNGNLDNLTDDDTQQLRLFYLGTKADATTATAPLTLGYADQEGTMESLTDADLLTGEVTATLQGTVIAANDRAVLERKVAHAHFKLNLPVAATEPMTVTITGDNVKNSIVMDSFNGDFQTTDGPITVTATAEGDFYMTVVPADAVTLNFTTSTGGKSYRGTLPARNWNNQEYVRAGEEEGVAITMTEYSDPYAEYADEDPRNPLHKFAKYNLTREEEQSVNNVFVKSQTNNGALYQWGRNYGYEDMSRNHGTQESATDFINWEDAFGDLSQESGSYQRYWDFYVYSQNGKTYYTGTGGRSNGYYLVLDEPKYYTSIADMKEHPTKFFMDGRYNLGQYVGNLGGYLFSTCNPDYWVWSEDGGSTWTQRAEKCGYATHVCPAGWRMPTKEDYEAIAPYETINDTQKLAALLLNHSELRQTKSGIRYVIKWFYRAKYLEIKAIVVDSDFQNSQKDDIVWENNPDVVTRFFPYTGAIYANGGYDGLDEQDMAYPYHPGVPDAGVFGYLNVQIGVGGNVGNGFGCYWMEDKGYAFKFTASEITGASTSYLKLDSADPVSAYAIRPVMDL